MNIIALFELLSFDRTRIGSLSRTEYTELKNELLALQQTNPTIQDTHIDQLLKALKEYPEPLRVVLNNRILFNYFAQKDYPRKYFSDQTPLVDFENIKSFVGNFFGEDLIAKFTSDIESNSFLEISHLAEINNYFPDSLNFRIKQHLLDNLDDAIAALKPPYGNFSKILYIKNRHFFALVSSFKDDEIEQKVMQLFEAITKIHRQDSNSELANKTYSAMHSYHALNTDFNQKINSKKEIADTKIDAHIPKRRNLTWVYITVGVFVFIRIAFFMATLNFNQPSYDDSTYDDSGYDQQPRQIDKYYTNMKYAIDSFQVFLTDYKASEIKQLKQDIKLKTGENPFQTFYQNEPTADSNHYITVTNRTGYDMVVLENAILYDSIKMPKSAHFIRNGDNLEINFNSSYSETIFNMYLGKRWATFQTTANKNLFIRNHSIVEYRFSQLVPAAREILDTDYSFLNDVEIYYSNGNLNVTSNGTKVNPISR